jgi:hypothetical protein
VSSAAVAYWECEWDHTPNGHVHTLHVILRSMSCKHACVNRGPVCTSGPQRILQHMFRSTVEIHNQLLCKQIQSLQTWHGVKLKRIRSWCSNQLTVSKTMADASQHPQSYNEVCSPTEPSSSPRKSACRLLLAPRLPACPPGGGVGGRPRGEALTELAGDAAGLSPTVASAAGALPPL